VTVTFFNYYEVLCARKIIALFFRIINRLAPRN